MLSNILKVASPILWGSIYIFDFKMITFLLKATIEDYCLFIGTLFSAVVLSPLRFDYRLFNDTSITHDKNHIKPYQMSRNVKNQGLNYPTHHIKIILRLETQLFCLLFYYNIYIII